MYLNRLLSCVESVFLQPKKQTKFGSVITASPIRLLYTNTHTHAHTLETSYSKPEFPPTNTFLGLLVLFNSMYRLYKFKCRQDSRMDTKVYVYTLLAL